MPNRLAQAFAAALARVAARDVPARSPHPTGRELRDEELGRAAGAGSNAKSFVSVEG